MDDLFEDDKVELTLHDSRWEQMRVECQAFHNEHPEVWRLFVTFTFEKINLGFKHYSSTGVFERIRWETDVPDVDGKSTFKINNNYSAFYARRFMRVHSKYEGFFRLRTQISKRKPAVRFAPLTPQNFPYENAETR